MVVMLARAIDSDCAAGELDKERVARFARAVIEFQEELTNGGVRTPRPEAQKPRTTDGRTDGH
ncbi:MAG TPA: hypothetical protein VIF15_00250 [Polyangiaceae bacterium]|jgi:hypothetical protein